MAVGFLKSLVDKFRGRSVDWEELEETLIRADLGVSLTMTLVDRLKKMGSRVKPDTVEEVLRSEITALFPPVNSPVYPAAGRPRVILVLGVNGTGKTTSTAKLAHWLKARGYSVLLAAADTFRAAAIEQLQAWGKRLGVEVFAGRYQADSASLCYDAYQTAARRSFDFLICDTAGRLHTKNNLMQELAKIVRTIGKHHPDAPDEKWLVIDATTGANGLVQAKEFHNAVGLTGILLTKLDGSGRGGIAAAIQHELGISPRFVGTGEQPEDFQLFSRDSFVEQLI
jgi:fused signal recognition particle receptor